MSLVDIGPPYSLILATSSLHIDVLPGPQKAGPRRLRHCLGLAAGSWYHTRVSVAIEGSTGAEGLSCERRSFMTRMTRMTRMTHPIPCSRCFCGHRRNNPWANASGRGAGGRRPLPSAGQRACPLAALRVGLRHVRAGRLHATMCTASTLDGHPSKRRRGSLGAHHANAVVFVTVSSHTPPPNEPKRSLSCTVDRRPAGIELP